MTEPAKIRLDKWLWAARFFKTRAIAKQAIEGGKVHYENARPKPSRAVELGASLKIRQGWDEKIVVVTGLSEHRAGAAEAALLYRETDASLAQREQQAQQRKLLRDASPHLVQRPTKKQRREIIRFKNIHDT